MKILQFEDLIAWQKAQDLAFNLFTFFKDSLTFFSVNSKDRAMSSNGAVMNFMNNDARYFKWKEQDESLTSGKEEQNLLIMKKKAKAREVAENYDGPTPAGQQRPSIVTSNSSFEY